MTNPYLHTLLALALLVLAGCDESSDEHNARAARFTTSTKPAPNPQREALDSLVRTDQDDVATALPSGPKFELYSEYKGEDIRQVTGVSGRTLMLVFTAPWCRHCNSMRNAMKRLASEAQGTIQVVEVNADNYADLANAFGITAVPTTFLYVEGIRLRSFRGAYNTASLRNYLRKVLSSDEGMQGPSH